MMQHTFPTTNFYLSSTAVTVYFNAMYDLLYCLMMFANNFSANQLQRKIITWSLREG